MARVKRTTISLDLDLLEEASEFLGTARMTDTVHAAMGDVVRRKKLEAVTRLRFPDLTLQSIKEGRRRIGLSFDALL